MSFPNSLWFAYEPVEPARHTGGIGSLPCMHYVHCSKTHLSRRTCHMQACIHTHLPAYLPRYIHTHVSHVRAYARLLHACMHTYMHNKPPAKQLSRDPATQLSSYLARYCSCLATFLPLSSHGPTFTCRHAYKRAS